MNELPERIEGLRQRYCPSTTMQAWDFTETELSEAIEGKRLLCPSLDLSNACNLNCPYCFTESADSPHKKSLPNELSERELFAVIDQMVAAGARTINIIGAGEPLLDPRFEKIARHIDANGVRLLVATNGTELVRRQGLLEVLQQIGANVILKLNSHRREVEDAMAGKDGYAEQRDQALESLIAAGFNKNHPSRIGINAVIVQGNKQEIMALHEYCRQQNIVFLAGPYMPTGRTGTSTPGSNDARAIHCLGEAAGQPWLPVTPAELNVIATELQAWDRAHGYPTIPHPAYTSGLPCVQSLGVYVDIAGKIWPCSTKKQLIHGQLLDMPLGDVRGEFNELWAIFRDHEYMRQVIAGYRGECPYK